MEPMIFYKVSSEDIMAAEQRMNRKFSQSLRDFYKEIGWGYFEDDDKIFINMLMSPSEAADFYCEEGNYEYSEEREFVKEDEFVFFEVDSNCHVKLKVINGVDHGVYFGRKIADSFLDFMKKMSKNSNYYNEIK